MNERADPEYWVLDGLEEAETGRQARLERADGSVVILPAAVLPEGVRGGDVLHVVPGPDGVRLRAAPAETERRREAALKRLNALNRPAPSGSIDL